MTLAEAAKLSPGLYRLYWKGDDGGASIAAVGMLHNGTRWFAPTNWTAKDPIGIASAKWRLVSHVEPLSYDW